jgi:hypothetical protein
MPAAVPLDSLRFGFVPATASHRQSRGIIWAISSEHTWTQSSSTTYFSEKRVKRESFKTAYMAFQKEVEAKFKEATDPKIVDIMNDNNSRSQGMH